MYHTIINILNLESNKVHVHVNSIMYLMLEYKHVSMHKQKSNKNVYKISEKKLFMPFFTLVICSKSWKLYFGIHT